MKTIPLWRHIRSPLVMQAGLSSAAFYIESSILFTLIVFDEAGGIWGSLSLFLILCAPYSLASLLSVRFLARFANSKAIAASHAVNAIALLFIAGAFGQTTLWIGLFLKSCFRGIGATAEIQHIRSIAHDGQLIAVNSGLHAVRQVARLGVPAALILFSEKVLSLPGLYLAALFYAMAAFFSFALPRSSAKGTSPAPAAASPKDMRNSTPAWATTNLSLTALLLMICFDAAINTMYPQFALQLGFARTVLAEMLILTGAGGMLGAAFIGRIARIHHVSPAIIVAIALAGTAIPMLTLLADAGYQSAAAFRAALVLDGALLGIVYALVTASLQGRSANGSALREGAFRNVVIGLGSVIGPLVAAVSASHFGIVWTSWLLGIASITVILLIAIAPTLMNAFSRFRASFNS